MENRGYFQQRKIKIPSAKAFHTFAIVLRVSGRFFQTKRNYKDGLVYVLLGCFTIFR